MARPTVCPVLSPNCVLDEGCCGDSVEALDCVLVVGCSVLVGVGNVMRVATVDPGLAGELATGIEHVSLFDHAKGPRISPRLEMGEVTNPGCCRLLWSRLYSLDFVEQRLRNKSYPRGSLPRRLLLRPGTLSHS